MEKRESSYTAGENVKPVQKKLKIELPYDPAIQLLGIYAEKTVIQRDICTSMFTQHYSQNSQKKKKKKWKQPKCPSTDEWIKKMWFIFKMYNGILFSL